MKLNLFITLAFWLSSSSVGFSKYLTCKFYHDEQENFTSYNPYMIEFWPDYTPLEPWVVQDEDCRYDVLIKLIPFRDDRMIDYSAFRKGLLPAINTRTFSGRDLQPLFDRLLAKSTTTTGSSSSSLACSYDTVWYDPPTRFHAYHGFKMTTFDRHHDYIRSSYAPVPFLRQVDAVFVDPWTDNTVFIANDWYYAFDRYGGFQIQGRWAYLWTDFRYNSYIDSVLVTKNKTLCRFYNDQVHCTGFDERSDKPLYINPPRSYGAMFGAATAEETGSTRKYPMFPLKGSFWISDRNQTIILDSNDYFWMYDMDYRWVDAKPFCDFEEFGKFPCCRRHHQQQSTTAIPFDSTAEDEQISHVSNSTTDEQISHVSNSTTDEEQISHVYNPTSSEDEDDPFVSNSAAEDFSQFWLTVWRTLLLSF